MSLEMRLGSRGNLLQPGEGAYSQVCHSQPFSAPGDAFMSVLPN